MPLRLNRGIPFLATEETAKFTRQTQSPSADLTWRVAGAGHADAENAHLVSTNCEEHTKDPRALAEEEFADRANL